HAAGAGVSSRKGVASAGSQQWASETEVDSGPPSKPVTPNGHRNGGFPPGDRLAGFSLRAHSTPKTPTQANFPCILAGYAGTLVSARQGQYHQHVRNRHRWLHGLAGLKATSGVFL